MGPQPTKINKKWQKDMQQFIHVTASAKCSVEDSPKYFWPTLRNSNLPFALCRMMWLKSDGSKLDSASMPSFVILAVCKKDWPVSGYHLITTFEPKKKIRKSMYVAAQINPNHNQIISKSFYIHSITLHSPYIQSIFTLQLQTLSKVLSWY